MSKFSVMNLFFLKILYKFDKNYTILLHIAFFYVKINDGGEWKTVGIAYNKNNLYFGGFSKWQM